VIRSQNNVVDEEPRQRKLVLVSKSKRQLFVEHLYKEPWKTPPFAPNERAKITYDRLLDMSAESHSWYLGV